MSKTDAQFMEMAMTAAKVAAEEGEVPVGAVLVSPMGNVIAMAGNSVESDDDPTAHAEMRVIRLAAKTLKSPATARLRFVCDARALCHVRTGDILVTDPAAGVCGL